MSEIEIHIFEESKEDIIFLKKLIRKNKRAIVIYNVLVIMFLATALSIIIAIEPLSNILVVIGQSSLLVFLIITLIMFIRFKKFGWYALFVFDIFASIFFVAVSVNALIESRNKNANLIQVYLFVVLIILSVNTLILLYKKNMRKVYGVYKETK
jgi:hypothetical protein